MGMQMHGSIACWKRDAPETRQRIAHSTLRQLRIHMPIANGIGAIIVYLYFAWAFPPEAKEDAFATTSINAIVAVIYFALAAVCATWAGDRANQVLKRWCVSDAPPTREDRLEIMRIPKVMVALTAINWGVAIPVFFLLNLDYSL